MKMNDTNLKFSFKARCVGVYNTPITQIFNYEMIEEKKTRILDI